jgi:hypothetical protein
MPRTDDAFSALPSGVRKLRNTIALRRQRPQPRGRFRGMERLCLIHNILQHHSICHQFIVDNRLLVVRWIVRLQEPLSAKSQVFGEAVVSWGRPIAMTDFGFPTPGGSSRLPRLRHSRPAVFLRPLMGRFYRWASRYAAAKGSRCRRIGGLSDDSILRVRRNTGESVRLDECGMDRVVVTMVKARARWSSGGPFLLRQISAQDVSICQADAKRKFARSGISEPLLPARGQSGVPIVCRQYCNDGGDGSLREQIVIGRSDPG